jgi:hypothetical protein
MGTRSRPPVVIPPASIWVPSKFPRLAAAGSFVETSRATRDYNCIAWAARKSDNWWWPEADSHWPDPVPAQVTVDTFVRVFARFGYRPCASFELQQGYEKVAIYVDANGTPTHMARQLTDGTWTSKLGAGYDITHVRLDGLDGPKPSYGSAAQALRRRTTSWYNLLFLNIYVFLRRSASRIRSLARSTGRTGI